MSKIRHLFQRWKSFKSALKTTHRTVFVIVDTIEMILVALVFALLIRKFIIQTSVIPSESMVSTLQIGDRLFVNKLVYRFCDPQRGDIVVFKSMEAGDDRELVKRCVGLPGETILVQRGVIYVNGRAISFPGVVVARDYDFFGPYHIPAGHYFMMGDNRAYSRDSRYWGTVSRDHVLGEAWYVFWPFSRAQILH